VDCVLALASSHSLTSSRLFVHSQKQLCPKVEWLDLELGHDASGLAHNAPLVGFSGGFAVDDFIILVPNFSSEYSGVVGRIRHGDFTYNAVESMNLREIDSSLSGFMGGFTDGTWGYLGTGTVELHSSLLSSTNTSSPPPSSSSLPQCHTIMEWDSLAR
jgi:hypothetical protein